MQWSNERILTTHTGSLPRPPELTRLYVRRARGEAVDPAELDRLGKAALRRSSTSRSKPVSISATTASSSARRSFSMSATA